MMNSNSSLGAIVVAAGSSTRMGGIDKTFNPILEKPMITYCLDTLECFTAITEIVLGVAKGSLDKGQDSLLLPVEPRGELLWRNLKS